MNETPGRAGTVSPSNLDVPPIVTRHAPSLPRDEHSPYRMRDPQPGSREHTSDVLGYEANEEQ